MVKNENGKTKNQKKNEIKKKHESKKKEEMKSFKCRNTIK